MLLKIMSEECVIVVCVVWIMGLNVVGVDLICFNYGLLVMEVNLLSGLEGIEIVIGKDIVGMIIGFMEKKIVDGIVISCMVGKG